MTERGKKDRRSVGKSVRGGMRASQSERRYENAEPRAVSAAADNADAEDKAIAGGGEDKRHGTAVHRRGRAKTNNGNRSAAERSVDGGRDRAATSAAPYAENLQAARNVEDRRGESGDAYGGNKSCRGRRTVRGTALAAEKIPFSRTEYEAEGSGHSALISALAEITSVKNVRRNGEILRFSVPSADKSKVVAILNSFCYNYKIIKESGLLLAAASAARRVGIIAGIAAAVAVMTVYPHTVTDIEAVGEWNADISRILTENGISAGKLLWNFDGDAVERQLLALDGVAFASVEKRGTRVYVTVREERDGGGIADVGTAPVTAKIRASVTRGIVYSGTLLVKYGDVVNAGQELIAPYIEVGEEKVPSQASGEVYGKTYRTYTRFFPDTETVQTRGASKTYTRLSFSGKEPPPPESPYGNYVMEKSVWRNGFLFGYTVYRYTFYEVSYTEVENTRTEDEMARETLSDILADMPFGAKTLDCRTQVRRADGGVYVTATVEAEERIDI